MLTTRFIELALALLDLQVYEVSLLAMCQATECAGHFNLFSISVHICNVKSSMVADVSMDFPVWGKSIDVLFFSYLVLYAV